MYEYTLEELIENILSESYSLSGDLLKEYLIKRYMVLNKLTKIRDIKINEFSKFICDLLYIKVENGKFNYYDYPVYVNSYFDDSISNIIENWNIFMKVNNIFTLTSNEKAKVSQIESFCNNTIAVAKRKSLKISGIYKKYFYDDCVLTMLNASYNIVPKFPIIHDLGPVKEKALSERTYEQVCKAYISAMKFDSKDNSLVVEKDVEDFISAYYENYFPNMKFAGRQKELSENYIADIILTSEDVDYILEIKNKKDDRLYWQVINYFNIYSKKTLRKVKVITIAPEYSPEMIESLKKLPYVEIKKFNLKIENGKIKELVMEDL